MGANILNFYPNPIKIVFGPIFYVTPETFVIINR